MESSTFKSVAFGGFDKQDVIRYIETTAMEHAEELRSLQEEIASLRLENENLAMEKESLSAQLQELQTSNEENAAALAETRKHLEALAAEKDSLQGASVEVQMLTAEIASLRPDAESYRQFRNRIGDIECDARKRAAELEASTHAALQKSLTEFKAKYAQLHSTFDVTSNHVNNELRRIEVTLSHLPRALDQIGEGISALEDFL